MLVNNDLVISLMQIVKYIINVNLSCIGFYFSKNFILFGFPIFRFWAYLLMMILETRRTQYIWYLRFHYYHWFPEGIIRPVISDSAMTWFIIIFITEIYSSEIM
jgi:hypothetical protein